MAPQGEKSKPRRGARAGKPAPKPARRRSRVPRFVFPLAVAVVVGFLYWRPLSSYVETRGALAERTAEVQRLRAERERLERRLARAASDDALGREARRIGWVRPGERMFIVQGIDAWRRALHATVPADARP